MLSCHELIDEFDMFSYADLGLLHNRPLLIFSEYISRKCKFVEKYKLPLDKFQSFLSNIDNSDLMILKTRHSSLNLTSVFIGCTFTSI